MEQLEERKVLSADLAAVESVNAPLFSIGEGVCSAVVNLSPESQAPSPELADAAFAGSELAGEGEWGTPVIVDFGGTREDGNMWVFAGTVLDDGPMGEVRVYVFFNGDLKGDTTVDDYGHFYYAFYIAPEEYGYVEVFAVDGEMMVSDSSYYNI
jgi:hypothetical protein